MCKNIILTDYDKYVHDIPISFNLIGTAGIDVYVIL